MQQKTPTRQELLLFISEILQDTINLHDKLYAFYTDYLPEFLSAQNNTQNPEN